MWTGHDGYPSMKADNDNGPLGRIYTLGEAADYLRMTKNALARVARRSGHCSIAGRDLLFSESDLLANWDEIRWRSQNSNAGRNGTSAAPLLSGNEASQYTRALALVTKPKRKSSGRTMK